MLPIKNFSRKENDVFSLCSFSFCYLCCKSNIFWASKCLFNPEIPFLLTHSVWLVYIILFPFFGKLHFAEILKKIAVSFWDLPPFQINQTFIKEKIEG
jgi:hypothetical protein